LDNFLKNDNTYQLSVSKTIAGFLLLHNLEANAVNSEIGPPRKESVFPLAIFFLTILQQVKIENQQKNGDLWNILITKKIKSIFMYKISFSNNKLKIE
jgi:hypothetical protein